MTSFPDFTYGLLSSAGLSSVLIVHLICKGIPRNKAPDFLQSWSTLLLRRSLLLQCLKSPKPSPASRKSPCASIPYSTSLTSLDSTDTITRIAEGQFYEAHQQLRVISARHTKAQNWTDAIEILYNGSLSLLKAGQGGSGGDLALLLVDTMTKGEVGVSSESKGGRLNKSLRAWKSAIDYKGGG